MVLRRRGGAMDAPTGQRDYILSRQNPEGHASACPGRAEALPLRMYRFRVVAIPLSPSPVLEVRRAPD